MDVNTASTPSLQARNVEILQTIDRIRNGEDVGTTEAKLVEEKRALQAELRRRGHPVKIETRLSSAESAALVQNMTNADAADLLRENLELKAKLAKAGVN